ncbi:MAG: ferritin family protein [Planctomycetes bacterium]|nr:ferritin family protein [Planctomycetota bacterium]MDE1889103.1 ferritin family protein [Planctomycetota bacterium]
MDIYKYAMQMEKDGESYYRELTEKIGNLGLKRILTMLADAEVIHYNILLKMKKNEKIGMTDTPILADVKNIFIKMKEEKEITGINISQVELYKKAQQIEEKSQNFYLDKAGEVEDLLQKEIFLKIAEEEKKHFFILESVIDFVSRPQRWLENAEWYHLDEY